MSDLEKAKKILKENNQEHLLLKYNELDDKLKEKLLHQILKIDFKLMKHLCSEAEAEADFRDVEIKPAPFVDKARLSDKEKYDYITKGIEEIKDNTLAVVTMAGGQGTRLGHTGPKGTYMLDLEEGRKSIFQILCENLKEAALKYGTFFNWYIMTSEQNNADTVKFFEDNNFFEYPRNYIKFFNQGQLPMVGQDGKILLTKEGLINEAADGHGGTLKSLKTSGIIKELREKNIKWVFISGVDNILAKLADPLLIGLLELTDSNAAILSLEKIDPKEKTGVVCMKNNKVGIVEYTEITTEMANMRDDYGSLVYGDANSNMYCYRLEVLEKVSDEELPYHTAFKKASYLDTDGKYIVGTEPNAYKFESFIFDSFEMTDKVLVLRDLREDMFAPIKNKEGSDSPETAKKLYNDYKLKEKYLVRYENWLKEDIFDEQTKAELKAIAGNHLEIQDRFYKELEFGTAGLRGVMGAGTNRINKYTITKATQGLANYLIEKNLDDRPVVISYDTRNLSEEFAEFTALCFNANGIKTYVFDSPRPIPIMSYAIREFEAIAGVMITASHNPPEYNGYKVSWEDGGQIVPPVDTDIITKVKEIKKYTDIKMIKKEEALEKKLYIKIGPSIEDMYIDEILKLQINDVKKGKEEVKIVYSPLHGTGNHPVQKTLEEAGYKNVFVVPEQELANGNFPTVSSPNPEDPKAMTLAIEYAKRLDADIVLATDPDCDRVGLGVKDNKGDIVLLNGNMIGQLLLEYILSSLKKTNKLPKDGAVISTIVSTRLAKKIAEEYNIKYLDTLTGFKNIAKIMREFEETKKNKFVFAFEESYGYLFGDHARDKDGVVAVLMISELAAYAKQNKTNILQLQEELYKKYGYYIEETLTMTLKGESGEKQIAELMKTIRTIAPKTIDKYKVLKIKDYQNLTIKNPQTDKEEKLDFEKTNMVYFELDQDAWIAIRPSGTEPKIKTYIGVTGKTDKEAKSNLDKLKTYITKYQNSLVEGKKKVTFREGKKVAGKE